MEEFQQSLAFDILIARLTEKQLEHLDSCSAAPTSLQAFFDREQLFGRIEENKLLKDLFKDITEELNLIIPDTD